jgi:hypothetical protein
LAQHDGTSSADTASHVNDFANLLRPVEGCHVSTIHSLPPSRLSTTRP